MAEPECEFVYLDRDAGEGPCSERLHHPAHDVRLVALDVNFCDPLRPLGQSEPNLVAPTIKREDLYVRENFTAQSGIDSKGRVPRVRDARVQGQTSNYVTKSDVPRMKSRKRIEILG